MFKRVGKIVKPFVNFPKWLDTKGLKKNNETLYGFAKDIAKPELRPVSQESFDEAMVRLQLTEQDVATRRAFFLRMAIFYAVFAVAVFSYGIYLFFSLGDVFPLIMALAVTAAALALWFKHHFWYIQMKQRRLGLTFDDWLKCTFKRG
jgi:intracellular multiplication protein IcmV